VGSEGAAACASSRRREVWRSAEKPDKHNSKEGWGRNQIRRVAEGGGERRGVVCMGVTTCASSRRHAAWRSGETPDKHRGKDG
jgi:hypothetical protein